MNRVFRSGYPIDLRRPDQVLRFQQGYFGDFEADAGRVVARLTGEQVFLQDDGSEDAMVDIRIQYEDGHQGWVEVWADRDQADASVRAGLYGRKRTLPATWPAGQLQRSWAVTVSGRCDLRRLRRDLEALLAGLEAGEATFQMVADRHQLEASDNETVHRLVALGVVTLASRPYRDGDEAVISLLPAGITGPIEPSWGPVLDWLKGLLASDRVADNRSKLAATGSPERHFFLGVTFTSPGEVYFALTNCPGVPIDAPQLPEAVTHLWVMEAEMGERCIVWSPKRGWRDAAANWATQ